MPKHPVLTPAQVLDSHPQAIVLSLDFFDTLVTRAVAQPTHVFAEMERQLVATRGWRWRGFALARVQAEHEARRVARIDDPLRDVTIAEISAVLAGTLGLNHDDRTMLVALEADTEISLARPVGFGAEILRLARARGMRIAVVSDNYMSSTHLVRMARAAGVEIDQSEVHVSCEHGGMKHNGALWSTVLATLGVHGEHVLHVGDNEVADGEVPRAHGIVTHVESRMDRSHRLMENTTPAVLALSRLEAHWRDSVADRATVDIAHKLGSGLVALVAAAQVRDVCTVLARRPIAGVHFAARDGWLAHRVWEDARTRGVDLPPAGYLAFSRSILWRANLREVTEETAVRFVDEHERLTPRRLGVRFGCAMRTVLSQDADIDSTTARQMVMENAESIVAAAQTMRSRVVSHLRQAGIFAPGHHLVVDLGWRGSTLADLAELVREETNGAATVEGRFVGLYWDATMNRTRASLHGLAIDDIRPLEDQVRLLGAVRLFETVITAPHGSVVDFADAPPTYAPVHAQSRVETAMWDSFVSRVSEAARESAVAIVTGTHPAGVGLDDATGEALWGAMMQVGHAPRADEIDALSVLSHVASVDHADDGIPLLARAPRWAATVPVQRYADIYDDAMKTHWLQGTIAAWRANESTRSFADHMVATWPFLEPQWVNSPLP